MEVVQHEGVWYYVDEDGTLIPPMPCMLCGAPSCPTNTCGRDGRKHPYGCVHDLSGQMRAACAACAETLAEQWRKRREQQWAGNQN